MRNVTLQLQAVGQQPTTPSLGHFCTMPSWPGYMKLKTDLDGVWILATELDSLEITFNEGTSYRKVVVYIGSSL